MKNIIFFVAQYPFKTDVFMDMNRTLGQCLEFYRTELKLDQTQAACEMSFNVSPQNIGRIERGLVKNPGWHTIHAILKAYNKSNADLENDMSAAVIPITAKTNTIEEVAKIPVINFQDVSVYVEGKTDVEVISFITLNNKPRSKMFAIKMTNNFMDSTGISYPKNSIVIFDTDKRFKNNKDALIKKDENVLFRRVNKEGNSYYLTPLNSTYPTNEIKEPIQILAYAVETRLSTY